MAISGLLCSNELRARPFDKHDYQGGYGRVSLSAQPLIAGATICSAAGIQRRARPATHVHCLRKEMHDGIAAAEDGDSDADVEQRLFQSSFEPFLTVGLLLRYF